MDTKEVSLLVFDDSDHFNDQSSQIADANVVKSIKRFHDLNSFENELNKIDDETYICIIVHVFHAKEIKGIKTFQSLRLHSKYNNFKEIYVSAGSREAIREQITHAELELVELYKPHQVLDLIEKNSLQLNKKKDLYLNYLSQSKEGNTRFDFPKFKYALITALYEAEFEMIKNIFDFGIHSSIRTLTKEYHIGVFKSNPEIKIVAAVLAETGMVDAAIIATQMMEYFKPEYLLMSGVCGGKHDLEKGDIVLAKKVFMFQKGKISDVSSKDKRGKIKSLKLFDTDKNPVDYEYLYDKEGNHIAINIEKFEPENDTTIDIDPLLFDVLGNNYKKIEKNINEVLPSLVTPLRKSINIVFEPVASSTMVINKKGYFEDYIKKANRKTAAVEMESYGVARATKFANDAKTKWIIFKSVMDNSFNKDDDAKQFAAYTSAQFLNQLFINKLI